MKKISIFNLRIGLACNSSSSHSILMVETSDNIKTDEYNNFHWNYFTAANTDSKNNYLMHIVQQGIQDILPPSLHKEFLSKFFTQETTSKEVGIDHQSVLMIPMNFKGRPNEEFIKDFQQFLLKPEVVIAGGNDNDDENHHLKNSSKEFFPDYPKEVDNTHWIARKDVEKNYWTLFNKKCGSKMRFSFDSQKVPQKATAPELVDIKITDYCPYECEFCYQDSTLKGKHASMESIKKIATELGKAQVLEVACLAEGTKVLSKKGYISIESLNIDDEVYTSDGTLKKINKITITQKDTVKVTATKGFSVFCTPDHPFISNGEIVEAKDLVGKTLDQLKTIETNEINGKTNIEKIFPDIFSEDEDYIKIGSSIYSQNNKSVIKVKSVEPSGERTVYDLTLENNSTHIFSLSQGVLTHNCGGGETSLHPNFVEILQTFSNEGIVVNFTTKNFNLLRTSQASEILKYTGAIAFSVESALDIEKVQSSVLDYEDQAKVKDEYGKKSLINLQFVMGTTSIDEFKNVLKAAGNSGFNITLLGYKENGRGQTFIASDYSQWIEVLKDTLGHFRKQSIYPNVSMDTALAAQYKQELKSVGLKEQTYHTTEGAFSMYIDAVANTMSPSSYIGLEQTKPFDDNWLENFKSMSVEASPEKPKRKIKIN